MVKVQEETTKLPITLMGKEAGLCYGTNIEDDTKNYKRGLDCIQSGHMRAAEFPQVYLTIDGYSARVIRELYTHIGGSPTRLQASTRYINYEDFEYYVPESIAKNDRAWDIYAETIRHIKNAVSTLTNVYDIPREDVANLLPLGMTTKIVLRTNLRHLIEIAHQRLCTRAYKEFRDLMKEIMYALSNYSDEWKYLVDNYFKCKCEVVGYCTESRSCGKMPKF